jgi:hypothetical protein
MPEFQRGPASPPEVGGEGFVIDASLIAAETVLQTPNHRSTQTSTDFCNKIGHEAAWTSHSMKGFEKSQWVTSLLSGSPDRRERLLPDHAHAHDRTEEALTGHN